MGCWSFCVYAQQFVVLLRLESCLQSRGGLLSLRKQTTLDFPLTKSCPGDQEVLGLKIEAVRGGSNKL